MEQISTTSVYHAFRSKVENLFVLMSQARRAIESFDFENAKWIASMVTSVSAGHHNVQFNGTTYEGKESHVASIKNEQLPVGQHKPPAPLVDDRIPPRKPSSLTENSKPTHHWGIKHISQF